MGIPSGLPLVERLWADTVFAAQLLRIRAGLGLFDDADDLCFGEAGLSQGGFLSRPEPQDFCLEKRTTLMGTRQYCCRDGSGISGTGG
jgi:hypothetical protein